MSDNSHEKNAAELSQPEQEESIWSAEHPFITQAEWNYLQKRRIAAEEVSQNAAKDPGNSRRGEIDEQASDLKGLAFSGGGIRSASFNLGFSQYLIANDLFTEFDYLSTVSGGGYLGGFLGAQFHDAQEQSTDEEKPPNPELTPTQDSYNTFKRNTCPAESGKLTAIGQETIEIRTVSETNSSIYQSIFARSAVTRSVDILRLDCFRSNLCLSLSDGNKSS